MSTPPQPGRRLLRLAGAALLVPYVAVALLGALVTSPVPLALCVLVTGTIGAAVGRSARRTPGLADTVWLGPGPAAVTAALFAPFAQGVEQLGRAGGYLVALLVVLFSVSSLLWAHGLAVPAAPPHPAAGAAGPVDPSSSRDLLRTLSVEDLAAEWRRSGELLHPSSGVPRHTAARWREALLEEFRHRDPGGFDEWLLGGGVQRGPGPRVTADPDDLPDDGALPSGDSP